MNEQLIVKNFGPIKDATVEFKKVTVFIGPTGGGKSTLAKLAAIFNGGEVVLENDNLTIDKAMNDYGIISYKGPNNIIVWKKTTGESITIDNNNSVKFTITDFKINKDVTEKTLDIIFNDFIKSKGLEGLIKSSTKKEQVKFKSTFLKQFKEHQIKISHQQNFSKNKAVYIPTERVFIPSIEYSWPGLMRDDIGLPKLLLKFANSFSLARKEVAELHIPFLDVKYLHSDGKDFIKIPQRQEPLMLLETASGIQSVTPLLVLLENSSTNLKQETSFIIEEPELNLYPTAQQGLLNWLIEKCTKGKNDLTITTHSPYILSHLNLLLYAYQVTEKHPDRADDVAKIVPRDSWINPKEFACYQVENGGVESLINDELGLIDDNGLDNLSGDAADDFDNLIRLSKSVALK